MSGANETRCIEWHETCQSKCRFNSSVCNIKQRWNDDKIACDNFALKTLAAKVLNSGVVIYLSWLWLASFSLSSLVFVL